MGLAFSLREGDKNINPSLRNIFSLMEKTLIIQNENQCVRWRRPDHGCLRSYAKQGVMFLNCTLTNSSIMGKPSIHENVWGDFVKSNILNYINKKVDGIVFLLLGNKAKNAAPRRCISVETSHPSPLAAWRGFNDSDIFNEVNELLDEGHKIDWFDTDPKSEEEDEIII